MLGFLTIGPWQVVLILAIVLIIFGPGKLPSVGKMFGKSIREFKDSVKDVEDAVKIDDDESETKDKKENKA